MTSGIFRTIPPADVVVDRASRQRRELRGIEELAKSISEVGLIHPIVLSEDLVLVAGERRLEAVRSLGWASIPYQLAGDLSSTELHAIELEENVKRQDLSWQDHTRAVAAYHDLKRSADPSWTQSSTAAALGYTPAKISYHLDVNKAMANPRIAAAPKFSVALGLTSRANERAKSAPLDLVPKPVKPAKSFPGEILNADFLTFDYDGPPINFFHCDFPYGIDIDSSAQGTASQRHESYADSPNVYFALLDRLSDFIATDAADSCHVMFWFSMKFYRETFDALSRNFKIDPFPLIWHKSDNTGILPDKDRGPRRTYETAFIGSRGDRKIVQPVANSFSGPTSHDIHMSEKPEPMLRHFFRMFVDPSSIVLDPTSGSGGSIRAAEAAGAKSALGLEINPEFAKLSREALERKRQ